MSERRCLDNEADRTLRRHSKIPWMAAVSSIPDVKRGRVYSVGQPDSADITRQR